MHASHQHDSAFLLELIDQLGAAAVLIGEDVPARNGNDWSAQPPQPPVAVVRPLDAQGVSRTLRVCARAGVPVVPQGGLTGLCGGARPEAGWLALSLERMVGIEEIDEAGATMTVRAGTPLEAVQRAADDAGFFFPLDLGARGSCSIGGNLATNAGGNRVIRYGMARDMVLGLEVVLPDGTIVTSLNKMLKNNAGYDLKQLFIGSEGTLGVITRAVLRLAPKPGCTMSALCAVPDYPAVLRMLEDARRNLGPTLSAFEVMWPDYWHLVTGRGGVRSPLEGGCGLYVLVEAQGTHKGIDEERFDRWMEHALTRGILSDAAVARSTSDANAFWALRDAAGELLRMVGPHISYDIGLPIGNIDAYAQLCKTTLAQRIPRCDSVYYGHIGDGNLHLVCWVAGAGTDQPKAAMDAIVYGLVRDFNGSISAEHGIGTVKKPWMAYSRTASEIALMKTLKAALDPMGVLNPGKVL